MSTECPKCGKNIYQAVNDDFQDGIGLGAFEIECPECQAKLLVTPMVDFYLEEADDNQTVAKKPIGDNKE
jgi:hypothetical protein